MNLHFQLFPAETLKNLTKANDGMMHAVTYCYQVLERPLKLVIQSQKVTAYLESTFFHLYLSGFLVYL